MKTIEYRTKDKNGWGDGPWQSEPDKKQWLDDKTGLPCLIVRGPTGALCGYVGLPSGHPDHGKDHNDIDVDVHWGLTFASACSHGPEDQGVCHKVEYGEPDNVWWFGFDCAHLGDYCPKYSSRGLVCYGDETYKDFQYVERETRRLANQLLARAA